MRLVVVTPVGPGHENVVQYAKQTVRQLELGPFDTISHKIIDDTEGKLGRSAARNLGMVPADWYFFLDADDMVYSKATLNFNPMYSATFGAVKYNRKVSKANVWPCGWEEIKVHKARGTLSMGFFVRADVANELKFNEDMDAGEDFDFYMRLPDFTKVALPLVSIGSHIPSAHGPRGYETLNWTKVCNEIIDKYLGKREY